MKVMFKGVADVFDCNEPVEQKLFQAGFPAGWAVIFQLHGELSSSDIDRIVTPDSISELIFTEEDTKQQRSFTLTGYSAVRGCTIRHRAGAAVTELQLTKVIPVENKGNEEAMVNG